MHMVHITSEHPTNRRWFTLHIVGSTSATYTGYPRPRVPKSSGTTCMYCIVCTCLDVNEEYVSTGAGRRMHNLIVHQVLSVALHWICVGFAQLPRGPIGFQKEGSSPKDGVFGVPSVRLPKYQNCLITLY